MPSVRAKTVDVLTNIRAQLQADAAQTSAATTATLARDLKAQMEADGRTVVVKDYAG